MMEESETDESENNIYGLYQFWVYLVFMIFCWVGQAVTGVMGDAICFELLGKINKKDLFSQFTYIHVCCL